MDLKLLEKHIKAYRQRLKKDQKKHQEDLAERAQRSAFYQSWTKEKIFAMTEEGLYEYLAQLWAMLIWGNKHYVVNKIIQENGFEKFKKELADLIWGEAEVGKRWDRFRKNIKGMGPAMMSEVLCHVHPNECILWNRRAYVGLNYLQVEGLPRYDYQLNGKKYVELSGTAKEIASKLAEAGIQDPTLLTVDYFLWDELQVEETLSQIHKPKPAEPLPPVEKQDKETSDFIHDEIRDKLSDIGKWLGFDSQIEKKVADGSKVDTVWEATIGNMGRVIYIFEVQTKGSIDSLIINLFKALNNPAVQGVVAVSDGPQLEKIKGHAAGVGDLNKKLKYWDYKEVLEIHDALAGVNESINRLGLVPQGF